MSRRAIRSFAAPQNKVGYFAVSDEPPYAHDAWSVRVNHFKAAVTPQHINGREAALIRDARRLQLLVRRDMASTRARRVLTRARLRYARTRILLLMFW